MSDSISSSSSSLSRTCHVCLVALQDVMNDRQLLFAFALAARRGEEKGRGLLLLWGCVKVNRQSAIDIKGALHPAAASITNHTATAATTGNRTDYVRTLARHAAMRDKMRATSLVLLQFLLFTAITGQLSAATSEIEQQQQQDASSVAETTSSSSSRESRQFFYPPPAAHSAPYNYNLFANPWASVRPSSAAAAAVRQPHPFYQQQQQQFNPFFNYFYRQQQQKPLAAPSAYHYNSQGNAAPHTNNNRKHFVFFLKYKKAKTNFLFLQNNRRMKICSRRTWQPTMVSK